MSSRGASEKGRPEPGPRIALAAEALAVFLPPSRKLHRLCTKLLLRLGSPEGAVRICRRFLRRQPRDAFFRTNLLSALHGAGRGAEANGAWLEMAEEGYHDAEDLRSSLAVFDRYGRTSALHEELAAWVERDPDAPLPVLYGLAHLAWLQADVANARERFERCAETAADTPLRAAARSDLEAITPRALDDVSRSRSPVVGSRVESAIVFVERDADPAFGAPELVGADRVLFYVEQKSHEDRIAMLRRDDRIEVRNVASETVGVGGDLEARVHGQAGRLATEWLAAVGRLLPDAAEASLSSALRLLAEDRFAGAFRRWEGVLRAIDRHGAAERVYVLLGSGSLFLAILQEIRARVGGNRLFVVSASMSARDRAERSRVIDERLRGGRASPVSLDSREFAASIRIARGVARRASAARDRTPREPHGLVVASLHTPSYRETVVGLAAEILDRMSLVILHAGVRDETIVSLESELSQLARRKGRSFRLVGANARDVGRRIGDRADRALRGIAAETVRGCGWERSEEDLLRPTAEAFLARDYPSLLHCRRQVGRLFETRRPEFLVVCPGRTPESRLAVAEAKNAGVPSIDVQVLFLSESARYKVPAAETMAVVDHSTRDLYVRRWRVPAERIHLVGSVRMDAVRERLGVLDGPRARSLLNLPQGSPILAFATQPGRLETSVRALSDLVEAMAAYPGGRVIVKLHPRESNENLRAYREVVSARGAEARCEVTRSMDVYELIVASDLVVTLFSNVGIEAAVLGRNVLALDLDDEPVPVDLAPLGVAVAARSRKEIPRMVRDLLEDSPLRREAIRRREAFRRENRQLFEGSSARRIVDLGVRLASKAAGDGGMRS